MDVNQKIEEYIRRMGVIHQKYPDMNKAPKSIADEYADLNAVLVGLQNKQVANWGKVKTSDGFEVDKFLIDKYETALSRLSEERKENLSFITPEDEERFEFPTVDFDALRQEMNSMENLADVRALQSKITDFNGQPLPVEVKKQLKELQKEMYTISMEKDLQEPEYKIEGGQMPVVKKSAFREFYDNAKEKITKVFSTIKRRLSHKDIEQEHKQDDREQ